MDRKKLVKTFDKFLAALHRPTCLDPSRELLVINTGGTFGFVHVDPDISDEVCFKACYVHQEIGCGQFPQLHSGPHNIKDHTVPFHLPPEPGCPDTYYWIFEFDPQIDSADMDMTDWLKILQVLQTSYHKFDGFVILHGTNTLSYTASALSFLIKNLGKPIIVTGSVIPFSIKDNDAVDNLGGSLRLAATSAPPEVTVYLDNVLLRGNRTIKVSNRAVRPFDSPKFPHLEPELAKLEKQDLANKPVSFLTGLETNIAVIHLFPSVPTYLVEAQLDNPDTRGSVIVGYGGGYMMTHRPDLLETFKRAKNKRILMVLVTLSYPEEPVRHAMLDIFQECGIIPGKDITLPAAVAKLAVVLGQADIGYAQKVDLMKTNISGEVTGHIGQHFSA